MGKCVRIRGSSKPPGAAEAASCLTLRSGRRVPSPSACSPRTTTSGGRIIPRRHRGSARRCCGAEGAKKSACGSPRRRSAADGAGRSPAGRRVLGAQRQQEKVPPDSDVGDGCGDSFERPKTPLMTDDSDADLVKLKPKHDNESHRRGIVVVAPPPPPPTGAEMEAFFAAAELAERQRFAEAYNYDVGLDCPLEGRFEWAPVTT